MHNTYASKNKPYPSKNRSIQDTIYNTQTHLKMNRDLKIGYPSKNRISAYV